MADYYIVKIKLNGTTNFKFHLSNSEGTLNPYFGSTSLSELIEKIKKENFLLMNTIHPILSSQMISFLNKKFRSQGTIESLNQDEIGVFNSRIKT